MKKLEKLSKKLEKISSQIAAIAFEVKDYSYRRKGGYFGTVKANVSSFLVIKKVARTKYLNTYICVNNDQKALVDDFSIAVEAVNVELLRLNKIAKKNNKLI